jgi:membrane associated rhomboid family serine protease
MLLIFGLWLMFAVAINWGGASEHVFLLFCGNTELILQGEIWRLFTAPLLHPYSGSPFYVLSILLGFYFLSPSLEEAWGSGRFVRFLASAAVTAYTFQLLLELVLPASLSAKLVPDYWFGAIPVVEAIAIAWALTFKGRTVNLFFVLPVSSRGLILFVVAMSVLYLIAGAMGPAGLIAPFGGMLSGWMLGGKPSPLRKAWLKYRLAKLDLEAKRAL